MSQVFCFRCEAEKRKKETLILHNIMCEKATREEIRQAGDQHMNRFTALWMAVSSYLREK